jgi:hypothetical protein
MKRILLIAVSCIVMSSCVHHINEIDRGVIIRIDNCRIDRAYEYEVTVRNLDKCSLTCDIVYYTDTEYRIGDTVTLCISPKEVVQNDTTEMISNKN